MTSFLRLTTLVAIATVGQSIAFGQSNWPLWNSFATRFINSEGRVVDHDADDRTTSEGQAYSLFFALVANDRMRFEHQLRWTEANLAGGNLAGHLPAWLWGRSSGASWRTLDGNSASDADLWIAYTLIEAGELWQVPEYSRLGVQVAKRIAAEEVQVIPGLGPMLMPGPQGFRRGQDSYVLNPSYLPLQVLWSLAGHIPNGPWSDIAMRVPELLHGSAPHGWILDWISYQPGSGFGTVQLTQSEAKASYDAIRVYLWGGMLDQRTYLRSDVLRALSSGMLPYLDEHREPPAEVGAGGEILVSHGNVGFAAAVMPLLQSFNRTTALHEQRNRLAKEHYFTTGLFGAEGRYYDQCLAMFATGWSEGRFSFEPNGNLQVGWASRATEDDK